MAATSSIDSFLNDVDFSFLDDLVDPPADMPTPHAQAEAPQEVPLSCDEVLSPTPSAGQGAAEGGASASRAQARGRYAKHWVFTVNHPTEDEFAELACLAYAEPPGNVCYLVLG